MKLKRYEKDINENSGVMYFADKKPKMTDENAKFEIIERLSQHWNEKLKTDFLVPRSLYGYSLDDLKRIEKFYLNENNEYCDFGCNYISTFVKENPQYDNEDFFEFVDAHNLANRDMGELQDISKEEIERLSKEWKPMKESSENPIVKQLGIIDLYQKLRFAAYNDYPRIKDKERYLRKLDNLFKHYQIWVSSYNDINYKSDLIELMIKINQFMNAYDLPIDKFHRFEIEKINFDRFNLKESYYVATGEEINKLPEILKDSGYGHYFKIKDNKLYFLASEDQETFDKIENTIKQHGYEIKLESVQFDTIDKNNIQQTWEYVKTHITKEDVENMVKFLEERGYKNYQDFNVYNYAINRLISNIFGGGEVESLLRIENDLAKFLGYTFETQLDILARQGYPNNIKPLTESIEQLQKIADLCGDGTINISKPSIFQYTIYRLPTEDELNEFANFPNLTAEEIENGFSYTIIGRGIKSAKNQQMICDSIQMLIDKYPENEEYKKALEIAKGKPSKYNYDPKMVEALHELKQQHSNNEAVESIRIEGDEIVFDVKCETEIQSCAEYNGFKLRFNHLCNIQDHLIEEKSEEEIIEHAKMIKEICINDYLSKLNESPDNISTLNPNGGPSIYNIYDYDEARPFAFILEGDYSNKNELKPDQLNELWVGDYRQGHRADCPFIKSNGGDYSYDSLLLGRLWFATRKTQRKESYPIKVISFWDKVYMNIELVQEVIKRLEQSNKHFDFSDWSLDMMEKEDVTNPDGRESSITKISSLKELGIKFMSDSSKIAAGEGNVYQKTFKKRTPLMYRQAIYGENTTYNFEEFLKIQENSEQKR